MCGKKAVYDSTAYAYTTQPKQTNKYDLPVALHEARHQVCPKEHPAIYGR
jgi:hypothetical protein